MQKALIFMALWMACAAAAFADPAQDAFRQAGEAYKNGDFGKAADLYEQVLQAGWRSPELHYNLANAHYRLRRLGKAILHYERALALDPGDADSRHNLALARSQVAGSVEALSDFFLERWWKSLRQSASSGAWGAAALALWWAGAAGFGAWILGKTRAQKKRGFLAGAACLALSLLPLALALSRASLEKSSGQAIVLEKTASLRSAPDDAGTEIQLLHEGMKVKLLGELNGWRKVCLENGEEGWLPEKVAEEI